MKPLVTLAAAAVALVAGTVSAQAGCAYPGKVDPSSVHLIPDYLIANMAASALAAAPSTAPQSSANAAQKIVGTWLVTYAIGGSPIGQAFIQWHDDGTEWENINFPIEGGNICLGSWKALDPLHVSRLHYGWQYTAGLLTGYFIDTETVKVAPRNAYTGVDDIRVFDLSGNLVNEIGETASAVRIAP
ncbi:MAG: hypothetical protein JWO83_354 [Caulobacteraceae bacterium]|nr:hypothetical protein [Caulobacteraceae bacterium]